MPIDHQPLTRRGRLLAALFGVSGTVHLVRPQVFEGIVPGPLQPHRRALVHASGLAELACAAGLLHPATRGLAGTASAGLLVAVFPANVQMTLSLGRRAVRRRDAASWAGFAVSVARLPVQWPLVRAALDARGG